MPNPDSKCIVDSKLKEHVLQYAHESLKQFMQNVDEDKVNELISSLKIACSQAKDSQDKKFYMAGLAFMDKFRDSIYGRKIKKYFYGSVIEATTISVQSSLVQLAHEVISLGQQKNSYFSFRA